MFSAWLERRGNILMIAGIATLCISATVFYQFALFVKARSTIGSGAAPMAVSPILGGDLRQWFLHELASFRAVDLNFKRHTFIISVKDNQAIGWLIRFYALEKNVVMHYVGSEKKLAYAVRRGNVEEFSLINVDSQAISVVPYDGDDGSQKLIKIHDMCFFASPPVWMPFEVVFIESVRRVKSCSLPEPLEF